MSANFGNDFNGNYPVFNSQLPEYKQCEACGGYHEKVDKYRCESCGRDVCQTQIVFVPSMPPIHVPITAEWLPPGTTRMADHFDRDELETLACGMAYVVSRAEQSGD